jgi:very-short-patch-repair endonuclease
MLRNIAPKAEGQAVPKARKLHRGMTLPEVLIWRELRRRPCGLKFRRQHPSGTYILDFFCSDARLAIEIDGIAHDRGDRPERDAARDAWFAGEGIATLRIPAADVSRDVSAAVATIVASARSRLPLHHPAAPGGPPPRDKLGED